MDWNTNTLLFTTIVKSKQQQYDINKKCDYCSLECTCVEKFKDVDEFLDCINCKEEGAQVHISQGNYKTFKSYIESHLKIDTNLRSWCSCDKCLQYNFCKKELTQMYYKNLENKKLTCVRCNYTKKDKCVCLQKTIIHYIAVWIPQIPVKTTPENSVYTITHFEISKYDFEKNELEHTDLFERLNWFLNNHQIKSQFSIHESLNTYDEVTRQQVKLLKSVLPEGFFFRNVCANSYFSGIRSCEFYISKFQDLYQYYSDPKTLDVLDTKKNPHMDRPARNPKKRS